MGEERQTESALRPLGWAAELLLLLSPPCAHGVFTWEVAAWTLLDNVRLRHWFLGRVQPFTVLGCPPAFFSSFQQMARLQHKRYRERSAGESVLCSQERGRVNPSADPGFAGPHCLLSRAPSLTILSTSCPNQNQRGVFE